MQDFRGAGRAGCGRKLEAMEDQVLDNALLAGQEDPALVLDP